VPEHDVGELVDDIAGLPALGFLPVVDDDRPLSDLEGGGGPTPRIGREELGPHVRRQSRKIYEGIEDPYSEVLSEAHAERRASLVPRMNTAKVFEGGVRADVEEYPTSSRLKGILRRTVQIAKRHRDQYFLNLDADLAPISVIITTLASRSYEYCVEQQSYDGEFDLLVDVLRSLPAFIETRMVGGRTNWFIWNETTTGENFAEKWNRDPRRAEAFWAWHACALSDVEKLADLEGIDTITKNLRQSFGSGPADAALASLTKELSAARRAGQLYVAPAIGLTAVAADRAVKVRPNTFFGSE